MKVLLLMLSDSPGIGGMEKHARELATGLADRGLSVTLVAGREHLHELPSSVRASVINTSGSRYSPALLLRIFRLIHSEGFDVIHAQGTKAAFAVQHLRPLIKPCRLIATIHGFKSRYPKAKAFDRLIAVSKTLAASINQPNVSVVYNGVKIRSIRGRNLPTADTPSWLAAGRLVPVKGFAQLIKAFRYCSDSLWIAGDGPERESLQQLIDTTGQKHRIHLLGHRNDLPELMNASLGVIISSNREGFSYVCAEALLLGKPVISTNVPIANELLRPEHIIETTTLEGLMDCLKTPVTELLDAQSEARATASRELTLDAMVDNTITIYRQVLQHEL